MTDTTIEHPPATRTRLREISHLFLSEPEERLPGPAPRILPVWLPPDMDMALPTALAFGFRMLGLPAGVTHVHPELAVRDPRTRWPNGARQFDSIDALRSDRALLRSGLRVCISPLTSGSDPELADFPLSVLIVPQDGAMLTPVFQALKQMRTAGCRRVVAIAAVSGLETDRLEGDAAFARLAQHARIYLGWQPGYAGAIRLGLKPDESPHAGDILNTAANIANALSLKPEPPTSGN